jgi:hypothetical protein
MNATQLRALAAKWEASEPPPAGWQDIASHFRSDIAHKTARFLREIAEDHPVAADTITSPGDLNGRHYLALRDACGYPLVWTGAMLKSPGDDYPPDEGCYPMTVLT